jgi:hypothetical protein
MEMEINIIHVYVNNDREKIWTLCKIAAIQKSFSFAKLFPSRDEKELEDNLRELKISEANVLIFNKKSKEIYWENKMKHYSDMTNDEFEVVYAKALEWLKEI